MRGERRQREPADEHFIRPDDEEETLEEGQAHFAARLAPGDHTDASTAQALATGRSARATLGSRSRGAERAAN